MTTPDFDTPEEPFTSLLIAYNDALKEGVLPSDTDVPTELRPRLERGLACLRRLRQLRPESLPPPVAPHPWTTLGRFQIRRELGRGGFGVVFLAHDPQLNRDVALKVPRIDALVTPELRERFRTEARAAAGLDHPNLVPVYEAGEIGPICYIASAYCPGPTLAEWLRRRTEPIPCAEAASLVAALADAVGHAHERGVIHRDLKPANVLLAPASGRDDRDSRPEAGANPRITDFGLAKLRDAVAPQVQTATGDVLGTPCYMAPEQAQGRTRDVGPAADVWALGVILYELLTGRPPFLGETSLETLLQVQTRDPVPPTRWRPGVPRDLETICLKCLTREPPRRYARARALADDLGRYLRGEPIQARSVGPAERGWRWCRRNPVVASLLTALVIVIAGGFAGVTVKWLDADFARLEAKTEALAKEEARRQEKAERKRKEAALRDVEAIAYRQAIALAQHEWGTSNVGRAERALESPSCPPELRGWEWHYLKRLCHTDLLTLPRRQAAGNVAFSPDGRLLAAPSSDNEMTLWDAATGAAVLQLPGPFSSQLVFSPDGRTLAAVGSTAVTVWDATTGRELQGQRFRTSPGSLAFSADGKRLAAAGVNLVRLGNEPAKSFPVKVWDFATRQEVVTFAASTEAIHALAFSPEGQCLATAGDDATVRLWDAATGKELLAFRGHRGPVWSVAFSPDGTRLASAGADRTVQLWDRATGQVGLTYHGHTDTVRSVAFAPGGQHLASAGNDQTVRVWDVANGQDRLVHRGHSGAITSVAFRPDGLTLASASQDRTVKVWDARVGEVLQTGVALILRSSNRMVFGVAFSPDGQRLVTSEAGPLLTIRDAATGLVSLTIEGKELGGLGGRGVCFSPDGKRVVSTNMAGFVHVLDAATGRKELTLGGAGQVMVSVAYSPDGKYLASGGGARDKTVKIWDAVTGRELHVLQGHTEFVSGVSFSPDGQYLASSSWDKTVKVWETATGREAFTFTEHPGLGGCVAFSADGLRLASGSPDGSVRIWGLRAGQESLILNGHSEMVTSVAFHPDGRRLASASKDKTIRMWDTATGQEVLTLRGHTETVGGVAFSPDGRRLASASLDGTLRFWDGSPPPSRP